MCYCKCVNVSSFRQKEQDEHQIRKSLIYSTTRKAFLEHSGRPSLSIQQHIYHECYIYTFIQANPCSHMLVQGEHIVRTPSAWTNLILFQQSILRSRLFLFSFLRRSLAMDVKTAESPKFFTKTIPHPGNDGKFNFRRYRLSGH